MRPDAFAHIMNSRMLGRTALRVSEIGFGAWGIGYRSRGGGVGEEKAARAMPPTISALPA